MNDMSNLQAIFGEVQSLQSRLKSKVADAEAGADKFKAAFQAAVNPESKDSIVTALKDAVAATKATATTGSQGSSLADQIQATLSALQDQLQSKLAGPLAAATAAAASGVSAGNTASTSTTVTAPPPVSTAVTASAATGNTKVAAVPPAAAPTATTIAAVNTTHAPYRVYDPSNPSAFVEASNPGGGPNLLASDLVFNPAPRPDSPHSVPLPTAAYGSAEWKQQSQTYQATYEKLCADNNDWNQKNIQLRTQTLLASPYAAFAGFQGANPAAASDPYTIASLAAANKMAV
jgi:hypothetical protein